MLRAEAIADSGERTRPRVLRLAPSLIAGNTPAHRWTPLRWEGSRRGRREQHARRVRSPK